MAKGNSKKEQKLQTLVSDYINKKYAGTIFFCDVAAGMKMNMFQAKAVKRWRSNSGLPDVYVLKPYGGYHALMLELKVSPPWKRNGELKSNEHLEAQAEVHVRLRDEGYAAYFTVGFDHTKAVIDWYMNGAVGLPPKFISTKERSLFDE